MDRPSTPSSTAVAGGLSYRTAGPRDGAPVLLLHGYPQSSRMWEPVLPAIAATGRRAIAPDLAGYGDSPPNPPATWERHVESVERLRRDLGLERVTLVVHDWGGLIGLRWACDNPGSVEALVISDTGFFPDGRWHGMAEALRTEGTGEELLENLDRAAFGAVLSQSSPRMPEDAIDEYWKCFADPDRRRGQLELYRSGDFEKLRAYEGRLAELAVPVLLLWGADDPFAPIGGAHRFARELGGEVAAIDGTGHFVWDDDPEACGAELQRFLERL